MRVARRLEDLPQVAVAFSDGRVSYSKVRAITRVAEQDDGIDWVDLARHCSAAQLDKLVRGVHRAPGCEQAQRDPEAAAWRLRTRTRYDEHGNFVLTVSGPAELLPVIRAGLDAKKAQLQQEAGATTKHHVRDASPPAEPAPAVPQHAPAQQPPSDGAAETAAPDLDEADLDEQAPGWPAGTTRRQLHEAMDGYAELQRRLRSEYAELVDDAPSPLRALQPLPAQTPPQANTSGASAADATQSSAASDADALLALAQDALLTETSARPDLARRRRPQLTARIDPLSGWARQADGELLPPSSLRGVMQTLPGRGGVLRLRPVTEADLRRWDLGRRQREVNAPLRELLGAVDGERCRFPGCTRQTKLHAHHVVYWRDGGPTDLANLVHREATLFGVAWAPGRPCSPRKAALGHAGVTKAPSFSRSVQGWRARSPPAAASAPGRGCVAPRCRRSGA